MFLFFIALSSSTILIIEAIDKNGNSHKYASAEYSPGLNTVHVEDYASEPYEKNFIKKFKITRDDGVTLVTDTPKFDNYVSFKFYLIGETLVQFEVSKSYRRGTSASLSRSHEMQKPVTQAMYNSQGSGQSSPFGILGSPWILIGLVAFMFLSRGAQPAAQANAQAPQSN